MMKKRNIMYGLSFAVAAFALAGAVSVNATAKAEGSTPTYTLTENDVVMPGASVRMVGDDKNGIRFPVRILLEDYTANEAFIEKTGTLVLPADSYTQSTDFTLTGAASNAKILNNETTEKWFIREETKSSVTTQYAETLTYMYNIPNAHLDTDFYVRGYVTMSDGTTIYSAIESRSMSYVADAALKSGNYEADRTVLEGYLAEYTVSFSETSVPAQTVKYGQTATDPSYSSDTFLYWTADGETEFNFATEIKSNVTLTAVTKKETVLTGEYNLDLTNVNETLKVAGIEGTVTGVTINESIQGTYENGVIKASVSGLTRGQDYEVKIATSSNTYSLTAKAWDMVISNETELNTLYTTKFNQSTNEGYYCLDNNIEATTLGTVAPKVQFSGILDGKGHVVSKYTGYVVTRLLSKGIIRNIAYVESSCGAGVFLTVRNYGLIENVYVDVEVSGVPNGYGVVGQHMNSAATDYRTVRNCVFSAKVVPAANAAKEKVGLICHNGGNAYVENCYLINRNSTAVTSLATTSSWPTGCISNVTDFTSESAFLGDTSVAFPADQGWASYWKVENGKLYFNNTVVME